MSLPSAQVLQGPHVNAIREVANSSNIRFVLDLEFVELLTKPQYLQFLAHTKHLQQESFLEYLKYLQVRIRL